MSDIDPQRMWEELREACERLDKKEEEFLRTLLAIRNLPERKKRWWRRR